MSRTVKLEVVLELEHDSPVFHQEDFERLREKLVGQTVELTDCAEGPNPLALRATAKIMRVAQVLSAWDEE